MILILLLVVGVIGRVNTLAAAACMLLAVRLLHLGRYFPLIERRSLEVGLLCLMISILVPVAAGEVGTRELTASLFSVPGWVTLFSAVLATILNAHGLSLLQNHPSLLICVVLGAVIGIVVFHGMPIGPLMATSLAACILWVLDLLRGH
ncbi:UPF0756 membrane protein [Alicyclobacillus cellulosilyticus]|uniref:UPF0756 membrane protein GCM10010885_19440 n=2 Tax=Alicyclobacillus cellulosilyticus TaxID=1003997 RepID=A0A917NLU1_9BACL|nr:UPF0756 membrane protein [Alicyclobacillus cellulosilyticus]